MLCRSHRRILQVPVLVNNLRTSLDTHLDARNEHIVLCQLDLRILDKKPLAGGPRLREVLVQIEGALHADDGLIALAHGELLQVVVGLEKHFSDARACQPRRLEHLEQVCVMIISRIGRVQGEPRLPALVDTHLKSDRQVLQIDIGCWFDARRNIEGREALVIFMQHQAAHALWQGTQLQPLRGYHIAGDALYLPPDVVLGALRLDELLVAMLNCVLALLLLLEHAVRHARTVHGRGVLLAQTEAVTAQREVALAAKDHVLSIGIFGDAEVVDGSLGQNLRLHIHVFEAQLQIGRIGLREHARPASAQVHGLQPQVRLRHVLCALHAHDHKLLA
mmetsp:Transcript_50853/g.108912  ORF Transcript_50853/g.108912 Transcript_50853/m.108912 type:complete len:334 (+) Transcript_50853:1748-2749(+)